MLPTATSEWRFECRHHGGGKLGQRRADGNDGEADDRFVDAERPRGIDRSRDQKLGAGHHRDDAADDGQQRQPDRLRRLLELLRQFLGHVAGIVGLAALALRPEGVDREGDEHRDHQRALPALDGAGQRQAR